MGAGLMGFIYYLKIKECDEKPINPTNVGLDVVERVNLLQQYHLLGLPELSRFYAI